MGQLSCRRYAANELFNSAKGQEKVDTGTGSVFYIWEWSNQMVDVFANERHWEPAWLIIVLPTRPRLVVGARVDWQQFFS
jgi:hypothetical protein